jgi:FkbM family methyltransferase
MRSVRASAFAALERARAGPGWGLGRFRLGRLVHRLVAGVVSAFERMLGNEPLEVAAFGLRFFVDRSDRQVGLSLATTGTYEPEEAALFEAAVQPGMTVVDVGANIGVYTLLAARAATSGRVIAFEPDDTSAALLERNVTANRFANVTVVKKALASFSGVTRLFVVAGHPALASLASSNARGSNRSVEVEVARLDDELAELGVDTVNIVKLDAQGAELDILEGAERTIARARPIIFFEWWRAGMTNFGREPTAVLDHLEQRGYSFASIDRPDVRLSAAQVATLGDLDLMAIPEG